MRWSCEDGKPSDAVDVPSLLKSAQGYVESFLSLSSVMGSNSVKADSKDQKDHLCEFRRAFLAPGVLLAEFSHNGYRPSRTLHDRGTRPSPHEVVVKRDALFVISLNSRLEGNEKLTVRVRKRRRRIVKRTRDTHDTVHCGRNFT